MFFRPALMITVLTGIVACSDIPALEGTRNAAALDAPYPALIPRATILAGAPGTPQITPENSATLSARLAALRNRASRLTASVVDAGTRSRMQGAISRAALR